MVHSGHCAKVFVTVKMMKCVTRRQVNAPVAVQKDIGKFSCYKCLLTAFLCKFRFVSSVTFQKHMLRKHFLSTQLEGEKLWFVKEKLQRVSFENAL